MAVLLLLGLLGGAGMWGMQRIHTVNQNFFTGSYAQAEHWAEVSRHLAQVRWKEKALLLEWTQQRNLDQAYTDWLNSVQQLEQQTRAHEGLLASVQAYAAAARAAGVKVSPLPGPSALVAALSVAGLPSDRFAFEGFLPAKASARRERLQALAAEPRTLIFYESSHRIADTLADMAQAFGDARPAVLARELTKLFETVLDGSLAQLQARVEADADQRKGEFVVLVQGAGEDADAKIIEGRRLYARLKDHLPPSTAAKLAAELSGAPRKALYGSD